uniref:Uncharacterized protein n=1 Tax=Globisporangium ultimum (strain ATCC 200006 / CBS 805.95 / DAOM BR144) TaxID=431595 RepID=K3WJ04_GLOUD
MSGTRPIPIGSRGRASPPTSSSSRGGSPPPSNEHNAISHSCPVHVPLSGNGGSVVGSYSSSYTRFQPPRAPRFGSLPEPSFLQLDDPPMPELLLPPPAQSSNHNSSATPSVIQFASSCPGDIGFLRQSNPVHHSWAPSPRALDEFDLSKSPALSVMSASRTDRAPLNNFRRVGQSNGSNRSRSFPRHASTRDNGMLSTHTELMEHLSITEEEQSFSDDSSEFNHNSSTSQYPSYPPPVQPNTQQQYDERRERRGSYGSLSDNGDGGVFHFEES